MTTSATSSASLSTTSLSGLGLTGLSSGLDTSSIITKLMAIESAPQTALQTQLTTMQTHTTALQSLNSAIAAIATTAKAAAATNGLNAFTATSSSSAVTAAASSSAVTGSISFTVTQLAQAQISVTGALTTWPTGSDGTAAAPITITTGSGSTATTTTVTPASTNLDDVVAAINGSSAGITATKVAAGTDGNGTTQYRLQLTDNSGAANAFSLSTAVGSGQTAPTLTTTQTAQDAQLTLYAGTAAEQSLTSSSNTFTGLLTGVDVTVSAASSTPVTLTVAADPSTAVTSANALTAGLISLFSTLASATAITTSSSTSGGTAATSTSGGVFTGDTTVRNINNAMLSATTDPVNGKSPSSIGITLTKDGTITFDQDTFTAAMASDPTGTMAMYQTIAGRISDASTAASDPYTGSLTSQVTSEQTQESSLSTQISDWTTRLATIQQQYETQFNAMEVALNDLSSQSSYITSQISGLTTNYESSS